MPIFDWILALIAIIVWGLNFLVSKLALTELPPLLYGLMRFILVAFPAVFFIKFPKAPWQTVLFYGFTINFLQFSFMLSSIAFGLAAGMTSLLMQMQAFFTVLLAALYFKERISVGLVIAFVTAIIGILFIIYGADFDTALPMAGFISVLLAGFFWACGNISIKKMPDVNMISLVVWGALFSLPLFLVATYLIEGHDLIVKSLSHITYKGWIGVLYGTYISTFVGYVIWGRLLATRPVGLIAPLTLLIPIIGFISNSLFFGERFTLLQWLGSAIVLIALCINVFWLKIVKYLSFSSK